MTIATSYEQVTNNSPDGAQMGKSSTEKNAFFGATPVIQPASGSQASVTATVEALTENSNDSTPDTTIADCRSPISNSAGDSAKATDINALFVIVDSNFADLADQQAKAKVDINALTTLSNQLR